MNFLRTKRKLFASIATGVGLAMVLTACSGGESPRSDGEPGEGGTLTFAVGNDIQNFNPPSRSAGGNDTWYVTRQLFESLVFQNPETQEIEPWLAETFEANEDATEFTFELREDVTFSDGTPLTATTVQANFDDNKEAGAESFASAYLANYVETEIVDEHTVIVKFSEPNAAFFSQAATVYLALVSEPSLETPFAERGHTSDISGSGPFVLESYTPDQSTVLSAREDYGWGPEFFENTGPAHLDRVEFVVVPEAGNRTGGLTSGQVDVAGGIAPNDIETVEASAEIISRANPGTVFGIYFNENAPIVAEPEIREAIALAVDAQEVRDGALSDHFAVATSPLSQTTQDYADVSDSIPQTDRAAAEQVLDGAGWTVGSDGIRERDGERLSLRIVDPQNFGPNADSIALLQQQLRAVGIEIEVLPGEGGEFLERMTSGDYELAWRNISGVDADTLRSDFSDAGAQNWPVNDEELNQRLLDQITIGDPEARAAELEDIQRALVEGFHFVPVHELTTVLGVSEGVSGVVLGADSRLTLLLDASVEG